MASTKTKKKDQAAAAAKSSGANDKRMAAGKGSKDAVAKKDPKKGGKPGLATRAKTYFKNVRLELKRVVWPTKDELVKYTGAVLGMLIFFGVLIAVVDAVIVPVLYAFSGLR